MEYLEKKLTTAHDTGSRTNFKEKAIGFVSAVGFVCLLPLLHIGVFYKHIWVPDKKKIIDRYACDCSCFDTIFRGRYEYPVSSYKHVYFNATSNTFYIWTLTVLVLFLTYDAIKYLVGVLRRGTCRRRWLFTLLVSVYPHYYSWWSYFNYWNEDFYQHWAHHMLFAVTELVSTVVVLNLCDSGHRVKTWKLLAVFSINLAHILISGIDQFIEHVVFSKGFAFQSLRDVGLMLPDIVHVAVPVWELNTWARSKHSTVWELFYREELMMAALFIILFSIFGTII
ncbi:uncharacterized protein LOC106171339 isoform X2 [Lingula anatina]|uniref:Uncharacterized protein LOC106171339 isoform X2 n=1 Tax=Lingula anatina TaxID=7574 RepID=A0A1S3JA77_LINAN|nr:uncharacterized protein LOC106171339 isoform X2 [Lingula anatina]|eukprot:XP_013407101.1 uncharacterized protein LOC106171339 isoform X2 [Lingula anatina]